VIPKRMIKLLVQTRNEVVEVKFIVVNAYSPYTTIFFKTVASCYGSSFLDLVYECEVPH